MGELPKNWDEWAHKFGALVQSQRAAGSPISYEWEFAKAVLRHVSGLPAHCVVPQREFIGENGQVLHMDFGIEINGHKIAIEVEGFSKDGSSMGKSMKEHNNWASRERALTSQGWKVIAITNKDFLSDPVKFQLQIQKAISTVESKPRKTAPKEVTPVVVKVEYPKPPSNVKLEKNKMSTGSILTISALVIGSLAIAVALIKSSNETKVPDFANPSNPDCIELQQFETRADLNTWSTENASLVVSAHLDGDGDGLIREKNVYPDDPK